MTNVKDRVQIIHICPDFPFTKLYDLLITHLERGQQNTVYVPTTIKDIKTDYPISYLGRDFGVIDRVLYFRKQSVIQKDIERKHLCEGVDIIHAHNLFSAGLAAYKLSKKYKKPYIVAVRNTDVNVFFHYMIHLRSLGIKMMRDAAAVVFLSPAYKREVLNKYVPSKYKDEISCKSYIIPNGIDNLFLDNEPTTVKKMLLDRKLRLIYIGEVNTNKNVITTLKACELLEKKGYKPKLTIVGRISDAQYNGLVENRFVQYYPQSPKEEVLGHLRENDIFIMPSFKETFGLVYIEALSQGLPIIYSKGQGVDGYFDEGLVGYHVEATNPNEIADSVEKIITDYSSISKRCIEASRHFSWKEISNEYSKMYNIIK